MNPVFRSRPLLAATFAVSCGLVSEMVPALAPLRVFSAVVQSELVPPSTSPAMEMGEGEAELSIESRSTAPLQGGEAERGSLFGGREAAPRPLKEEQAPPVPLLDPEGRSLDGFFHALERTHRREKGALTRVLHFGDSMIVSDYVSSTLRRLMQSEFGDGGHGYQLIANAWPAYYHADVFRFATSGFRVSRLVGPKTKDGLYGLGGVTFRAHSGLRAQFGTVDKGELGRSVGRFELSYLASPGAGQLQVFVDDVEHVVLDTNSDDVVVKRHNIVVPDGPHRFELVTRGAETRVFGVVMEREGPGVVWDALGVQGARIRFLDEFEDAHFADELRWREPALIVYQFGANESGDGYAYPMPEYHRTMKAVIEQAKRAVPKASCLIVGAMDRARVEDGQVTSMRIIQLIVEQQELVARELGCAYFDTYASMGGWGSMPKWVKRGLGQADMTHPTGVGAERIGTWIYRALMARYGAYLESTGR